MIKVVCLYTYTSTNTHIDIFRYFSPYTNCHMYLKKIESLTRMEILACLRFTNVFGKDMNPSPYKYG